MQNDKLHNDLKQLSAYVYRDGTTEKPAGWISIKSEQDKETGFYAESFYKDGQVAVVYRGSDDTADWLKNNREMGLDIEPAQKVDAEKFYQETKDSFPNQAIVVTGHSLGGSLAQIVGSETGAQTVTFNAYGTGGIIQNPTYADNITNYGNPNDPVFLSNIDNQIGNTYLTNVQKAQNKGDLIAQKDCNWNYNKDLSIDNHNLNKMGDLSNSVEYNKNTPLGERVLKASVEFDADEKGNEIFTREDIANMSPEEYQKNEPAIMAKMKESGIPTKAEVDSEKNSSNSSKVSGGPTSSDGEWVTINGHHVLLN